MSPTQEDEVRPLDARLKECLIEVELLLNEKTSRLPATVLTLINMIEGGEEYDIGDYANQCQEIRKECAKRGIKVN